MVNKVNVQIQNYHKIHHKNNKSNLNNLNSNHNNNHNQNLASSRMPATVAQPKYS